MEKLSFWEELIRRKVVKVTVSYVAVAWLLIQVADIALESFGAPEYLMQAFILFTVLGIPVVLVLSWAFDVTPAGIKTTNRRSTSKFREAIAVLPFSNMSSDEQVEHMADGLSDNIITGFQQQLEIDVTSRNSTFVYKNQPVSITSVAAELDVAYVLEGSIQKQGDVLRVTAQLINAQDDSHLWADHFDRRETDAFVLQDELTESIVSKVKSTLQHEVDEPSAAEQTPWWLGIAGLPPLLLFSLGGTVLFLAMLAGINATSERPGEALLRGLSFEIAGSGLLLLTLAGLFIYNRSRKGAAVQVDIDDTVARIEQLIAQGHLAEAYDLAQEVSGQLNPDTYDVAWWDQFSAIGMIKTVPANASVEWRPYNGRNVEWREIGVMPEDGLRFPIASLQFRLSAPGYVTQEFAAANPSQNLHNPLYSNEGETVPGLPESRVLTLSTHEEPGMVYAAERLMLIGLTGLPFEGPYTVSGSYMDVHPVSNAEYLAFVQSGAYLKSELWEGLPWPEDIDWRKLLSSFVDSTDQPGPAGWELGQYPDGAGNHPVTGVSWYEAEAYARWSGKRLPSVHEWARAALPLDAGMTPIAVAIMNFSNFHGRGKHARGEYPSLSAVGCYDMFGNVREWAWNEVSEGRASLGGCDTDLPYFAVWVNTESPMIRDADHGFRCCKGDVEPALLDAVERNERNYEGEQPVPDEVFKALVQPLTPVKRAVDSELLETRELGGGVTLERYQIASGYGERISLYCVFPKDRKPCPALVNFPGMGSFMGSTMETDVQDILDPMDFVIRQLGCALVFPAWTGAFERFDGGPFPAEDDLRSVWFQRTQRWIQEAAQSLNFAEEHPRLDANKVGFLGVSFGATNTLPILALEPRFKSALLFSGSLMSHYMFGFADSKNYLPRVKIPVLFMNGRYDSIVSADEELLALRMSLLGTDEAYKKQVLYDAGHWPFPQHLFKKEVADWLKTTL